MPEFKSHYILLDNEINFTMPEANPENVIIIGDTHFLPLTVAGNAKDNYLVGNAEANAFSSGGGNDTFVGGKGDDMYFVTAPGTVIVEETNGGLDTVNATVSYTLSAHVENLVLTDGIGINPHTTGKGNALNNLLQGNSGHNALSGGEGDDTLNGGTGGDTLDGGTGNDTYYINDLDDLVFESVDGGSDTVVINIEGYDVSKLKNIESVKFAKDFIADPMGAPLVMPGADGLPQEHDKDTFVFQSKLSAKKAAKKIADFDVAEDTIALTKAVFKQIAKKGDLSKDAFYTGLKAKDANDRIGYDKKSGVLSYDADGSGNGAAIKFAILDKNLKMTAHDFLVI